MLAVLVLLLGAGTTISLTGVTTPPPPAAESPPVAALGSAPTPLPTEARRPTDAATRAERPQPSPTPDDPTPDEESTRSAPAPAPAPEPAPEPRRTRPRAAAADPATGSLTALEDEVTTLTNAERAAAGCGAVTTDERLRTAARGHSQDMADHDYFSHTGRDGRSPFDRMADAGYPSPAGENIAYGYRTPADVVAGWMSSSGHRANILTCSHQAIGVGLVYDPNGRPYWTQVFGR